MANIPINDLRDKFSAGKTPTSQSYTDLIDTLGGLDPTGVVDLTGYASEVYVDSAIAGVVNSAPSTLNTLNELASALGDDASFATTVTNAIADKADSTHTHIIGDVTDLQTSLDAKADSTHTHIIDDVTDLQTSLDAKADSTHTHVIDDVADLQTSLDAKIETSKAIAMTIVFG